VIIKRIYVDILPKKSSDNLLVIVFKILFNNYVRNITAIFNKLVNFIFQRYNLSLGQVIFHLYFDHK